MSRWLLSLLAVSGLERDLRGRHHVNTPVNHERPDETFTIKLNINKLLCFSAPYGAQEMQIFVCVFVVSVTLRSLSGHSYKILGLA